MSKTRRWVIILLSLVALIPVSYTHLDVYKRQVRKEVTLAALRQTNSAASNATSKNTPTQISLFFVVMNSIPKHQRSQHKIQPQNRQRLSLIHI